MAMLNNQMVFEYGTWGGTASFLPDVWRIVSLDALEKCDIHCLWIFGATCSQNQSKQPQREERKIWVAKSS